jgi:hypothetical protein
MSDETPWLPLKEAAARCERSGIWSHALNDILGSGRVPVRGKRSGYAADPIEELLRRVSRPPAPRDPFDRLAGVEWSLAGGPASRVSFWPALNQITLRPDARHLREDRQLAAELGDQFAGQITDILLPPVTFTDVVVHWPKLVEEVQAAGYKISLQSGVTSGRRRQRRNAAPLRRAPDSEIHKAIAEAYDSEETAGAKPSNLKQIAAPVKAILRKRGYEASGNRIQELAGDTRHVGRRRKRGVTVASEKRGQ